MRFGKRASVSSTLTWIYAIFVLLFILAIFLLFAFAIAGKSLISNWFDSGKSVSDKHDVDFYYTLGDLNENPIPASLLLKVLTTEVDKKSMKKIISESVDVYFDKKLMSGKTPIEVLGDINKLSEEYRKDNLISSTFYTDNNVIENDMKLINDARKILGSICKKYMLKVPQGIITAGESYHSFSNEGALGGDVFDAKSSRMADWALPVILRMPYRNQIIELKFRILKECA
ncbi:MAG: hypothetical protein KKB21_03950 [Nanoarchaeota archaeon]|nr:hypothetical protein [Nanoarchaeota archaeon]MBU4086701.1 hypothetical protein [Nanoarchaeota archaeon]